MKISFLIIKSKRKDCINKDFMAGYGWAFNAGTSLRARLINIVKKGGENVPLLAFGYMASIFKSFGHQTECLTNKIPDSDITFISSSMVDYREEIAWAKQLRAKGRKVAFIGVFASAKPEEFLSYCDFLIKGEPEEACFDIARSGNIPQGLVISQPVKDLDSLPFPDWKIFPYKEYSYLPALKERPFLPILSMRGCAFKCSYCPYPAFYAYRYRSVENVLAEIEYLKRDYGMQGMLFRDPLFSGNKRRAQEIAEGMIRRKINVKWACETRLDCLNEELLKLFYKAGCRVVNIGVESSDPDILKNVNRKNLPSDTQKRMVDFADRLGIRITGFYVLGLPGENSQSIEKTIEYAKWLNTHVAQFFINTPFPGTSEYEENKDRLIESDWEKFDCYTPVVKNDQLSSSELLALKEKAFVSYYYRPRYVSSFLRRVGRAFIHG